MITTLRVAIAVIVLGLSLTTLAAGQRPAGQPAAAVPEVFCDTMQAGALCPTATVGVLKLSGPKAQQWVTAVGKYNAAVMNATKQLKADASSVLTPAQLAELDRWMASGINPEVNRILASRNAIQR